MVCFSHGSADSKASVDARLRIECSSIQFGLISYTTTVSSSPKETDHPTANSSIAVYSWHRWTHTSTSYRPASINLHIDARNECRLVSSKKQASSSHITRFAKATKRHIRKEFIAILWCERKAGERFESPQRVRNDSTVDRPTGPTHSPVPPSNGQTEFTRIL